MVCLRLRLTSCYTYGYAYAYGCFDVVSLSLSLDGTNLSLPLILTIATLTLPLNLLLICINRFSLSFSITFSPHGNNLSISPNRVLGFFFLFKWVVQNPTQLRTQFQQSQSQHNREIGNSMIQPTISLMISPKHNFAHYLLTIFHICFLHYHQN